jgi:hypothetical protein
MKCPKCGYVSHDYLDACRKCSIDLVDFKTQMQLYSIKAGELSLELVLSDGQSTFVTATGLEEPFYKTSMLVDSNTDDDFDISLDNDLNISPISISIVDESIDTSKLMLPSNKRADGDATPSESASEDHDGLGPPQSGYATIMLDVSNFESKLAELDSHAAHSSTDEADIQEPVGDVEDNMPGPPGAARCDDPSNALDPEWDKDPMATVDTRAISKDPECFIRILPVDSCTHHSQSEN